MCVTAVPLPVLGAHEFEALFIYGIVGFPRISFGIAYTHFYGSEDCSNEGL